MEAIEYSFAHDRISKAAEQRGLTLWKVAQLCDIKPSSLYQYVKRRATPNGDNIAKLATGLQTEPGYFFAHKIVSELTNEVKQ